MQQLLSQQLTQQLGVSPASSDAIGALRFPTDGALARVAQLRFGVDKGVLTQQEARELVCMQSEILRCNFHTAYEDEHIVAVAKPWDVLLSPDKSGPRWAGELSLRDWLKHEHPSTMTEDGSEVRLCHNLDFATSGVICAAKSREAANDVSRCFRDRTARKLCTCRQPACTRTCTYNVRAQGLC